MGSYAMGVKKVVPEWLKGLLGSEFFNSCVDHQHLRKSEKNMFCIDCNLSLCKHCNNASSHYLHRSLQICKYVYHDVVRLHDIQKYLDCSKIQTYKINGEKAVHLNPRPQSKDSKYSKPKGCSSCEACGKQIQDIPNQYCSIACKISLEVLKDEKGEKDVIIPKDPNPFPEFNDLSVKLNCCPEEEEQEEEKDTSSCSQSLTESSSEVIRTKSLRPKHRMHKRKGFPRRAPFF